MIMKKKFTKDSKLVVDLISLLEDYRNKGGSDSIPELALYLAKSCRVIVV